MIDLGDWNEPLAPLFADERYKQIRQFLIEEYKTRVIYPDMYDLYNCFRFTPFKDLRVVLLGQDPYHNVGQAHGLCFSVKKGVKTPPSLVNIYKELNSDLGLYIPNHGELTKWAEQGILLLNTALTVRKGQANSHRGKGWETFTDNVIKLINQKDTPVAFILWGSNARAKKAFITNPIHRVFESAHPSPLSAYNGFFGCKHFSKVNEFLTQNNITPIDWQIEN